MAALRDWGLSGVRARDVPALMSAIALAYEAADRHTAELKRPRARAQLEQWNQRIVAMEVELERIGRALAQVEADLIAEATIIAATLTSAYLRDELQARSFDTVLLDEASMAPIPALWVAASRAKANVVAVGDSNQLSPICVAEKGTPRSSAISRFSSTTPCLPKPFVARSERQTPRRSSTRASSIAITARAFRTARSACRSVSPSRRRTAR
jgi:hypothetical protein